MKFCGSEYIIKIWENEQFPACDEVIIDTETTMVDAGYEVPELVLVQAYAGGDTVYLIRNSELRPFFETVKNNVLVMHNAAFDVSVLCKYLEEKDFFHNYYQQRRIKDTQIMWKLFHLCKEGYVPFKSSLAYLFQFWFKRELDKDGDIRHNFGQFKNQPIENIPKEFIDYAVKDVIATRMLYKKLAVEVGIAGDSRELSHDIQIAGHLALERVYQRGISFNRPAAIKYLDKLDLNVRRLGDRLSTYGWVRGVPGSKEAFSRNVEQMGIDLPKTETGTYSSKEEDLKPYAANNDFIKAYLDYHSLEKTRSFIENIKSDRVHPRYKLLMNTGRTSCSGSKEGACNIQQLPRDGAIRSFFVPKDGHSFIITDYTAIELCALAQVTYKKFGYSKMRDLINEGRDLHKYAASQIYGVEEDKIDKKQRLLAKVLNFGLGANMSHKTFVDYAAQFGVILSEDESLDLKEKWSDIFPEMPEYWNLGGRFGDTYTHTTLTGRIRANATYTAYLNTGFQGLAADGAKIALYYLENADIDVVAFVHDEVVSEVKEGEAKAVQEQQENIMIKGMGKVIPDVAIRVESQITKEYCK